MGQGLGFLLSILGKFSWLGNWLFFLIALAECVPVAGGFFPGGTLIYFASVLAAQGYFNVWDIFIYAALGAILGDYLGYSLGRWGAPLLERYKIIKPETFAGAEDFFKKYGNKSILWGRFIGPIRAVVPFVAGASKMPAGPFLFWNIIGALIWSGTDTALGYFSGNIIAVIIKKWSARIGWLILIVAIALFIYWLVRKHGQSFREYFRRQNLLLKEKLLSGRWLSYLDEHYPALSELYRTGARQGKIIGLILGLGLLFGLYLLTLIFDLF
jgi:undecaprenyl-diphosphatase